MGARRRRWPKVLAALALVVLLAVVGLYWYARPLLMTGTGYAAHNDCAVTQLAGRSSPATDLPPNPLVPYLRSRADGDRHGSTVLHTLAGQTAWYTPGQGCTLAPSKPAFAPLSPVSAGPNPLHNAPTPGPHPTLDRAVATAFGDDLPEAERTALGTRAVIVVKDGRIVAERYAPGFDRETRQLGWSMTKSAASLMAGRVALDGKLRLGDNRLFPTWTDDRAGITVEDLLRMRSGLEWDETYDLGTPITRMLYLEPDMAAYVAGLPLAHAAGTYQQYSSGSSNLLCRVLRDRTGLGPEMPRVLLFEPLGLSSAVLEPDAAGTPVCSSYLWATPRDWAAIGQFALQDGRWGGRQLLPEGWMSQTVRAVDAKGESPGYAAGWWANRAADGSLVDSQLPAELYMARGHDGQRIMVDPSTGVVVVRLGFSPSVRDLRLAPLVQAANSAS